MNSPEFERFRAALPRAEAAGLVAAAEVYAQHVREYLAHGYTTDNFPGSRGVENTVEVTSVFEENGKQVIRVGSDDPVTLWWELGHLNLFTKRHERVEHWRYVLETFGDELSSAYGAAFAASMESQLG